MKSPSDFIYRAELEGLEEKGSRLIPTVTAGLDFPGWKVFVDGQEVDKFIPKNDKLGRMWFNLAAGEHSIYAKFENTSIRRFSNLLSIFSWTLLLLSAVLQFNSWKKSRM